jgi:CHASE2 domain-containing sensor protein
LHVAAKTRGGVAVLARAAFLILNCLVCIVIGFFLPMAPVVSALIGSALWAGVLATAGAFAGMGLSDELLTRLEKSDSGSASAG